MSEEIEAGHYEDADSENVLLEENQGSKPLKWVYITIGILSVLSAVGIFYVFLKDAPLPIKVEKIKQNSVKEKVFPKIKVFDKKELKTVSNIPTSSNMPTFPNMPTITIEPKKIYTPKLIKTGEGSLDISQNLSNLDKTKIPIRKVGIKNKTVVKAYRGGISSVAGVHQYDPNLSLARGTLIPCSMNTRLISMVSGQLTCTVSEDLYSVNGNVLLLEKGSMAVGSYKSEQMQNGTNRLYAIWDDIRTPNNVIVSVGSGAADELGSAGMVGEVDNHWGLRFGGAVLVSIIEDVLSAGSSSFSRNQSITLNTSNSTMNQMGQTILKKYIDIPPTLYKNHGDLIHIFVNKDIDFSQVYSLER